MNITTSSPTTWVLGLALLTVSALAGCTHPLDGPPHGPTTGTSVDPTTGVDYAGTYDCSTSSHDGQVTWCPYAPDIILHKDGTYTYADGTDTYHIEGSRAYFDGALEDWGAAELTVEDEEAFMEFTFDHEGSEQVWLYVAELGA